MFQRYSVKIYLRVGIGGGEWAYASLSLCRQGEIWMAQQPFFLYMAGKYTSTMGIPNPMEDDRDCPSTTHSPCLNHDFKMAFQTLYTKKMHREKCAFSQKIKYPDMLSN